MPHSQQPDMVAIHQCTMLRQTKNRPKHRQRLDGTNRRVCQRKVTVVPARVASLAVPTPEDVARLAPSLVVAKLTDNLSVLRTIVDPGATMTGTPTDQATTTDDAVAMNVMKDQSDAAVAACPVITSPVGGNHVSGLAAHP